MTPETNQAISILIVNVLAPCLIFNKILISLDTEDIVSIAVMLLTSVLYTVLGLAFALAVKVLTPNPKYWFGGLLIAGMFTNSGDLPIAYVTTLAGGTSFTSAEGAKGIAYCTIFMSTLSFFLYNMGAFNFIAHDFRKMKGDIEKGKMDDKCEPSIKRLLNKHKKEFSSQETRRTSLSSIKSTATSIPAIAGPEELREKHSPPSSPEVESTLELQPIMTIRSEIPEIMVPPSPSRIEAFFTRHHIAFLWEFIKNFGRPPSFTLVIALICTFIPPIRRLFYVGSDGLKSWGAGNIPTAPDGLPILGFIMDFTSFAGAAQVPLGLMMLGAAAGQLQIKSIPKGFWKSSLLMCIFKLVVLPIIAIAWMNKMKNLGWIEHSNKMAQLVMILSSGVPTPTMIIYLTAIFRPKDSNSCQQMDCVAIYLIMQYAFLTVTMTILLSYTLVSVIHL